MSLQLLSSIRWTASELLDSVLTKLGPRHWYIFDAAVICTAIWTLLRWRRMSRQRVRTTQLRGPSSKSLIYGVGMHVLGSEEPAAVYERWTQEYGHVYTVPWTLGRQKIVLCDPKAIAHYCTKDTWSYAHLPVEKKSFVKFVGRGLLWADGESHRRQRKSLMPAFSVPATRDLTSTFYDSAYKAKAAWDAIIESSGKESALIEVQTWVNHISLDNIGYSGFAQTFGSLEGKQTPIVKVLDAFTASHLSDENKSLFLLGQSLPFVLMIPTARGRLIRDIGIAMEGVMNAMLSLAHKERELGGSESKQDRSIIGMLIKGMHSDSDSYVTEEEVSAQIKALLIAGYETVSISLTWSLIELSRNPDIQTRLRNELIDHGADPTYEELTNGLPYLDAFVHEILRVHPAVPDNERVAIEDDVIPLSEPIRTKSGALVDSLTIAAGTLMTFSMEAMNRSPAFWGEDSKVFRPSRWLEDGHNQNGIPARAKELPGHRHLLTFIDGPRTCPGKNFAIFELKVALTVLVKNFVFELRDGVDSKIVMGTGMLGRPKMAGEVGCKLPLYVRPYSV